MNTVSAESSSIGLRGQRSRRDLQRRNPVPVELKDISHVNRTTGEITYEPGGDHGFPILLFRGDGIASVLVSRRRRLLPSPDCIATGVRVVFVNDNAVRSKAL